VNSGERTSGRPTPDKDLASRFEILNGLLNTLTDVLDISEVFDHVSQVVQRMLPHDLMGVVEISEGGDRVRLYVGAGSKIAFNLCVRPTDGNPGPSMVFARCSISAIACSLMLLR
jgi:hypothetical protein